MDTTDTLRACLFMPRSTIRVVFEMRFRYNTALIVGLDALRCICSLTIWKKHNEMCIHDINSNVDF